MSKKQHNVEINKAVFESQGRNSAFTSSTENYCSICNKDEIYRRVLELLDEGPDRISFHFSRIEPEQSPGSAKED